MFFFCIVVHFVVLCVYALYAIAKLTLICMTLAKENIQTIVCILLPSSGCIDGTHLRLTVPKAKKEIYMNRKGYTSINCMAVAGPDRQFYAVSVQCSGRVHDARVLAASGLADL